MNKFYALSEPTRQKIIEMLSNKGELSASEISSKFPSSSAAISQHLKVLKEANLVTVEKRAQQRIYKINKDAIVELENWAKKMTAQWEERFNALDELLQKEKKNTPLR